MLGQKFEVCVSIDGTKVNFNNLMGSRWIVGFLIPLWLGESYYLKDCKDFYDRPKPWFSYQKDISQINRMTQVRMEEEMYQGKENLPESAARVVVPSSDMTVAVFSQGVDLVADFRGINVLASIYFEGENNSATSLSIMVESIWQLWGKLFPFQSWIVVP